MKKLFALLSLLPCLALAAGAPATLFDLAGVQPVPARLAESVVVVIDAQQEYVDGALPLAGVEQAVAAAARLVQRARAAGAPVVHVLHRGGGRLFNPAGRLFAAVEPLAAQTGEAVVEKRLPNAFAGTSLQQVLKATGRDRLIVVGFMTHMCVSSTVRAALDLGYTTTVVAAATATRDLPDGHGGVVPAAAVQQAALAALADRFAVVVDEVEAIRE